MSGELLSREWLETLASFEKLFLGFSGGLDSTVLLHIIAAAPHLKSKLQVVHVHHGLSPNATGWQQHCLKICELLNVPCHSFPIQLSDKRNLEESARSARYAVFANLLGEQDALVLGHHGNDQAETLLLQLLRGAGVDGLAAMPPIKVFAKGSLLRPLLTHSRQTLEEYAAQFKLTWVEDESNFNCNYSRNFIRHKVMPLLTEKWPGVVSTLGRSAEHFQEARDNLQSLAKFSGVEVEHNTLEISSLLNLNDAQLKNILRMWLKHNQVRMPPTVYFSRLIHEVILAREDAMPLLSWDNCEVRRYQNQLHLLIKANTTSGSIIWDDLSEPLNFGDYQISAQPSDSGILIPDSSECEVQTREGGERFVWHGQTKSLKKLLQAWKIPTWEREQIPLLYINGELAAIIGYAISDNFFANGDGALTFQMTLAKTNKTSITNVRT